MLPWSGVDTQRYQPHGSTREQRAVGVQRGLPGEVGIEHVGIARIVAVEAGQVIQALPLRCLTQSLSPCTVRRLCQARRMKITHQVVAFDAADMEAESSFWAAVMGGTVHVDSDWHMIMVDGAPRIGVQLAPDHRPPDWPENATPQQVHLDLWVEDFDESHQSVMSLGARLLQEAEDPRAAEGFQVYADPAGHPFCLCWDTRSSS